MKKTRSKRFKGWDKVKIVNDHGIEKEAIAPVIISASWRTDIDNNEILSIVSKLSGYEVHNWYYEVDNWYDERNHLVIEAKKSTDEHNFEVVVRYDYLSGIIRDEVLCLSPIPENKLVFCLKLLNYCTDWEDNSYYNLCPYRHAMVCKTHHSVDTIRIPIGEALTHNLDCSIDNLEDVYMAIEKNDLRYLIGDIHPIHFHNYNFH